VKAKENKIVNVIDAGMFDENELGSVKAMVDAAGGMLDSAASHDICGTPVFKAADGKWYVGTVEFSVAPVNPKHLIDKLVGDECCECPSCGHIDKQEDMVEIGGEDTEGDGLCSKCAHISFLITKARAKQIARGVPLKRKKR